MNSWLLLFPDESFHLQVRSTKLISWVSNVLSIESFQIQFPLEDKRKSKLMNSTSDKIITKNLQ